MERAPERRGGKGFKPGCAVDRGEVAPAIDAGDPDSDYSLEPGPNGCRINMGACGGTEEATSKPGAEDCE